MENLLPLNFALVCVFLSISFRAGNETLDTRSDAVKGEIHAYPSAQPKKYHQKTPFDQKPLFPIPLLISS